MISGFPTEEFTQPSGQIGVSSGDLKKCAYVAPSARDTGAILTSDLEWPKCHLAHVLTHYSGTGKRGNEQFEEEGTPKVAWDVFSFTSL